MNATRRLMVSAFVAVVILSFGYVKADFTFGEPVNVGPIVGGDEVIECLSYDGLEMYIVAYDRPGGQGDWDLWVVRRTAADKGWGPPENLGPAVNTPDADDAPSISVNGLTLYFHSYNRLGGYGNNDIYVATRATKNDPWGEAVLLEPPINRTGRNALDGEPWISPDGLELYFVSRRSGGSGEGDIWVARRATENDPWGQPINLGPVVNSPYEDVFPSLSPDGLLLLFCDSPWDNPPRPGGHGDEDTWMTRRVSLSDPWQAPVNLGPIVNSPGREAVPRVSPDGRTLYFWSNRGGFSSPNWQAPILPIVDFNGDGKVDGKEVLVVTEHQDQNYPLCDIGPFAWGDGVVDAKDLTVLAEYMDKELVDPTLIAHWALDEAGGATAHDRAGGKDATLVGSPVWQQAGKVSGALAFDGLDDFGLATITLNPPGQPLSVLAWVKGGAPGEVVISEQNGKNWLYADAAGGCLATALNSAGRTATVLSSPAAITDGQWHRLGVVWDGTHRVLYLDDEEVARDALPALDIPSARLVLGGGSALSPATFWSGLIDDVRVYDRVVKP